ncbi:MAG TPA: GNAT family N-acetyltransferase [Gaiellaceae bacterium]|nr:GNAT family N-acetyltransferase [Gaiellaceae bacterium]
MIATDGVVTLRAPMPGDVELLIAGRDEEFFKWFGPGATGPRPVACVWVDERLVGWVDYDLDSDHDWLEPGEVNVGYYLFPGARGKGYASRAVELLLGHLKRETEHSVATLLIHPENVRSLALADRLDFVQDGEVNGEPFFRRNLG